MEGREALTDREIKLHFLGAITFLGIMLVTLFLGKFLSPLALLLLRLSFVFLALCYHLGIYYYLQKLTHPLKNNDVEILFNGKKLQEKLLQ
ncbi:hypothetical protein DS745_11930 [Anaerobacillus alkaliphilus]|uniref:Uncharacterized protein n=1 Tax=Anaerobacillus alkaliphilus TaxID=1548597 RepID=A0A4Q0VSC4_9BACI|nr:hypothetical protein [Anaerobacillus alkaliphilus]RXJ00236.1 hypothetical protein DS745_11930 [Anaerobacillus alkaliphilus]